MESIPTYTYTSDTPGPALLFFGAIHGNEPCGARAIRQIRAALESGSLKLARGSVTFVPICNPRAYAAKRRFIDVDLNRVLRPWRTPKLYEHGLANQLCALVHSHDALIDLHSTTAPTKPFAFLDVPTKSNRLLLESLGVSYVLTGWEKLYPKHVSDTQAWATTCGLDAAVVECGQHTNKKSVDFARKAILRSLAAYGLTHTKPRLVSSPYVRIDRLIRKEHTKDRLVQRWPNFSKISKGSPLIVRNRTALIRAPFDSLIIMPKFNALVGEEFVYLGREQK